MGSLRTQALLDTTRKCRPFSRAAEENVASMRFEDADRPGRPGHWVRARRHRALRCPERIEQLVHVCDRGIDPLREPAALAVIGLRAQLRDEQVEACSGWRRSWLAAARKRDLDDWRPAAARALLDLALERRVRFCSLPPCG